MKDEKFLKLALLLAMKGRGTTSPNPLVGAVVVKGNRIIAQGFHRKFGGPHAEAVALHACGNKAKGATLYVNLEPCCHYGKTPPCTDLIIRSGIKRVVCSTIDSNPQVNGKGIKRLKKAGIEVNVGILEPEAKKLNEAYFKYITTKLPFVTLKVMGSLNGRIIQPVKTSKLQQKMLASAYETFLPAGIDAILLDAGIANNYNLVQVDSEKPKLILTGTWKEILSKFEKIRHKDIILVPFDQKVKDENIESKLRIWQIKKSKGGEIDLLSLLRKAGEEGITSVLLEGENKISTSFLKQKMVDKIWYQIFPEFSGKGEEPFGDLGIKKISDAVILKECEFRQFKNSLLVVGYPA